MPQGARRGRHDLPEEMHLGVPLDGMVGLDATRGASGTTRSTWGMLLGVPLDGMVGLDATRGASGIPQSRDATGQIIFTG